MKMNVQKMNNINSNSVESEYTEISTKNAWRIVYQKISRECQAYPYTCSEAKKLENKPLNRYKDVHPYDHSRVILKRCERDYINANLVKVERANRKYILTQGPLFSTVEHFWLMVWEQNSKAILMLNKIIEEREIKCHWYWPHGIGEQHLITLNDVKLTVKQISEQDFQHYTTRVFRLHDLQSSTTRDVVQFHYTTWPDHGVPTSPDAFLDFVANVRSSGALDPEAGPAVVHCSAGIGRSGTFCLVDSCLVIIEKEGVDSVNIQEILLTMRKDRMGLIQTPDQLRFSYRAIIEGIKRLDPNWKKEQKVNECIYSPVSDDTEEEYPPSPPPRGDSLHRPPARPLPAIPNSVSLGNMNCSVYSTDSEENPSTLAAHESSSQELSDDEADDEPTESPVESGEKTKTLRRRQTPELSENATAVKRRNHDAERGDNTTLKRFLNNPITITCSVTALIGIFIYTYFYKH